MPERRQNFQSIAGWVLLPAIALSNLLAPVVAANTNSLMDSPVVSRDSRARLQQIEKQRMELHNHAAQLRKQEQIALVELSHIQTKLNKTTTVLHVHEHNMQKTESNIKQTEIKITKTQSAEEILSESASKRLREIFEGNRSSFVARAVDYSRLSARTTRSFLLPRKNCRNGPHAPARPTRENGSVSR
ncbi:MAG: hypothetical protein HYX67_07115 [Candidatus Melainabacteria bacterium]|nr:hypothetical protein [Candidatus Melainabacteria bacterium]